MPGRYVDLEAHDGSICVEVRQDACGDVDGFVNSSGLELYDEGVAVGEVVKSQFW